MRASGSLTPGLDFEKPSPKFKVNDCAGNRAALVSEVDFQEDFYEK
jgi:hypothetical protein